MALGYPYHTFIMDLIVLLFYLEESMFFILFVSISCSFIYLFIYYLKNYLSNFFQYLTDYPVVVGLSTLASWLEK